MMELANLLGKKAPNSQFGQQMTGAEAAMKDSMSKIQASPMLQGAKLPQIDMQSVLKMLSGGKLGA